MTISNVTPAELLEKNKKRVADFNTLVDCVKDTENLEQFKKFYGDGIKDFFYVDGRSEKRIYNILKKQDYLEVSIEEHDGEKFYVGYQFLSFYKGGKIDFGKGAICRVSEIEPETKENDPKNILEAAAMRVSFYQNRATDKQISFLAKLCKNEKGADFLKDASDANFLLTKKEASFAISNLK